MQYNPSYSEQPGFNRERGSISKVSFHHVRSDVAIEEEIWTRVLRDPSLGSKYQENIAIEVEDGRAILRGHVTKPWHIPLLADIAGRVRGVVVVDTDLTADPTLREQIVMALVANEVTSPYVFTVRCSFGWVSLHGLVPSQEIAKAAEGVVGFVPGVRGILALPTVFGSAWEIEEGSKAAPRRALQPRIATPVVRDETDGKAREVGWVSQVIIDPCSRLVSAIAVSLAGKGGATGGKDDRLVPVEAIEAVSERKVWLRTEENIERFPAYERSKFLIPPPTWRPPFPYDKGMVRWAV